MKQPLSNRLEIKPNPHKAKHIDGAKRLIKVIQHAKGVNQDVKRFALNHLIWLIGDAPYLLKGKNYRPLSKKRRMGDGLAARYCSFKAKTLLLKHRGKGCERDHVFERSQIIESLLSDCPNILKNIERRAVVCLLEKNEHKHLTSLTRIQKIDGWERYALMKGKRQIQVWDRQSGKRASLQKLLRACGVTKQSTREKKL